VLIHLATPSRTRSSGLPGSPPSRPGGNRWWDPLAPLFGLAPHGVCRAPTLTDRAVGSYPTFSPLPEVRLSAPRAVSFLWHFPSRCRGWVLPSVLPPGVRTFLAACPGATGASTCLLRCLVVSYLTTPPATYRRHATRSALFHLSLRRPGRWRATRTGPAARRFRGSRKYSSSPLHAAAACPASFPPAIHSPTRAQNASPDTTSAPCWRARRASSWSSVATLHPLPPRVASRFIMAASA